MTDDEWIMSGFLSNVAALEMTFDEFKEKQSYVVPARKDWESEPAGCIGFYEDPVANPLTTPSGLLDDGWEVPRCVEVCGPGALSYVDEEELDVEAVESVNPEAATEPSMAYFNLPKRFIGGIAVDLQADEVVIGATVELEDKTTGNVLTTETDEFGDFWFHQIEPAEYSLCVTADGYTTRTLETSAVDADQNVGVIEMFAL